MMSQLAKASLGLFLLFGLGGWLRAANIVQDTGANYIAWEAESNVTINNGGSVIWAPIVDPVASGGGALQEQGASDTANANSTAAWTLVFNTPGTYQLYIKYLLSPCCGANSYKFPNRFGGDPDPNGRQLESQQRQ